MSACEKCWAKASRIARITGRMTADVYRELIDADVTRTTASCAAPVTVAGASTARTPRD